MKNKIYYIFLSTFFGITSIVSADNHGQSGGTQTPGQSGGTQTPSPSVEPVKLENPLAGGGINDIPTLVERILEIVLMIGIPIIVIAVIFSGYKFIAAQGNPEKLKEAKQTLVYVFVGAAILLGAYAIAEAIVGTITAIRG